MTGEENSQVLTPSPRSACASGSKVSVSPENTLSRQQSETRSTADDPGDGKGNEKENMHATAISIRGEEEMQNEKRSGPQSDRDQSSTLSGSRTPARRNTRQFSEHSSFDEDENVLIPRDGFQRRQSKAPPANSNLNSNSKSSSALSNIMPSANSEKGPRSKVDGQRVTNAEVDRLLDVINSRSSKRSAQNFNPDLTKARNSNQSDPLSSISDDGLGHPETSPIDTNDDADARSAQETFPGGGHSSKAGEHSRTDAHEKHMKRIGLRARKRGVPNLPPEEDYDPEQTPENESEHSMSPKKGAGLHLPHLPGRKASGLLTLPARKGSLLMQKVTAHKESSDHDGPRSIDSAPDQTLQKESTHLLSPKKGASLHLPHLPARKASGRLALPARKGSKLLQKVAGRKESSDGPRSNPDMGKTTSHVHQSEGHYSVGPTSPRSLRGSKKTRSLFATAKDNGEVSSISITVRKSGSEGPNSNSSKSGKARDMQKMQDIQKQLDSLF